VKAIVINPICAHTLAVRPLVIETSSTLTIRPMPGWEHDLLISVDGQAVQTLQPHEVVRVRRAEERVHLVQLPGTSYFQRIRHTLHWGDLSHREEQ
jgi:NAD+ kinase